jgi:NAD-dependent dihydropyrimidine dehydrogenase PreA subunit
MSKNWYPIINEEMCSICHTCVDFCPHEVFVIGKNDYPKVVNPDNCVEFCRGCAKICPSDTITYFGDIG